MIGHLSRIFDPDLGDCHKNPDCPSNTEKHEIGVKMDIFERHRQRLMGIAYRMLGTRSNAEDILQDAYVKWMQSDTAELRSPEAWLVTVVTRLCIDRLRLAKAEREHYVGEWLPEPWVSDHAPAAEHPIEMANDLSIAFLVVLERLSPEERAAFLLKEVFEFEYAEIAQMIGKNVEACRQLVHRARGRVKEGRPRFEVSRQAHLLLLKRFMEAARTGDMEKLKALFAEDISLTGDGGGKVPSVLRPLHGAERVAKLYYAISRRYQGRMDFRISEINDIPGIIRHVDGKLDSAVSLVTDGVRSLEIYVVRNPEKLKSVTY